AQDAVLALDDGESSQQEMPMSIIIITSLSVAGAAGGAIGAILFLKKRRRNAGAGDVPSHIRPIPQIHKPNDTSSDLRNDIPNADVNDTDARSSLGALFKPGHSAAPVNLRQDVVEEVQRQHQEMPDTLEQTSIPPISGISADPQIDRSILSRIVGNILTEKPHLRPEDQQVLKFLAEKEGAVFESEIRSKFQIPKTTIWRLVKRLEREELVEIRKAGGQNLIKLRFEDRQA
nr:hypothetical protein [Thermoproteota archaeon]